MKLNVSLKQKKLLLVCLIMISTFASANSDIVTVPKANSDILLLRPYDFVRELIETGWADIILEHQHTFDYSIHTLENVSFVFGDDYFGMSLRLGFGMHPLFFLTDDIFTAWRIVDLSLFGGYHFGTGNHIWEDFSIGYQVGFRVTISDLLYLDFGPGQEYFLKNNFLNTFLKIGIGIRL